MIWKYFSFHEILLISSVAMINTYIAVKHYKDIAVTALYFLTWILGEVHCWPESDFSLFSRNCLTKYSLLLSFSVFFSIFNAALQVLKKYPKYTGKCSQANMVLHTYAPLIEVNRQFQKWWIHVNLASKPKRGCLWYINYSWVTLNGKKKLHLCFYNFEKHTWYWKTQRKTKQPYSYHSDATSF